MTIERGLYDSALHAASSAVNKPHLLQSCPGSRRHVLFHHGGDVAGGEGMQVQFGVDGNFMHSLQYQGRENDAVTTVLIPPRTEKSPTTVMLRGSRRATRSSRI